MVRAVLTESCVFEVEKIMVDPWVGWVTCERLQGVRDRKKKKAVSFS
jgi:hypothetical protein